MRKGDYMSSSKERKIDKIFTTWVTAMLLLVVFLLTSICIMLIPQLFVAFVAAFCFFVVYAMYANAKNNKEVSSGVYDSLIYHDEEQIEKHLK